MESIYSGRVQGIKGERQYGLQYDANTRANRRLAAEERRGRQAEKKASRAERQAITRNEMMADALNKRAARGIAPDADIIKQPKPFNGGLQGAYQENRILDELKKSGVEASGAVLNDDGSLEIVGAGGLSRVIDPKQAADFLAKAGISAEKQADLDLKRRKLGIEEERVGIAGKKLEGDKEEREDRKKDRALTKADREAERAFKAKQLEQKERELDFKKKKFEAESLDAPSGMSASDSRIWATVTDQWQQKFKLWSVEVKAEADANEDDPAAQARIEALRGEMDELEDVQRVLRETYKTPEQKRGEAELQKVMEIRREEVKARNSTLPVAEREVAAERVRELKGMGPSPKKMLNESVRQATEVIKNKDNEDPLLVRKSEATVKAYDKALKEQAEAGVNRIMGTGLKAGKGQSEGQPRGIGSSKTQADLNIIANDPNASESERQAARKQLDRVSRGLSMESPDEATESESGKVIVRVRAPNGRIYPIPQSAVEQALQAGGEIVKDNA